MRDYSTFQIRLSQQLDVPLLKLLEGMAEEELVQFVMQTGREFLTYLAQNQAQQQIDQAVKKWTENQLPNIDKYEVVAEDITLISYVRKQTFLHFIPDYSQDVEKMIELIREIDLFTMAAETTSTNTYISLLKERINEHSHFIQKINNTTPGAIYVFDVANLKGIYSNGKLKDMIGYDHEELNELGHRVVTELMHPDDVQEAKENFLKVRQAQDGEIRSHRFRIKTKDTTYRWIRIYESVFKRARDGSVTQTIGIVLDVDKEKKVAEQLQQREQQLLEAQDIAQIGSFVWEFETKRLYGTPKMYEILEIEEENTYQTVFSNIYPADRQKVANCLTSAIKTGVYECEYRYNGAHHQKTIWSKGVVTYKDNQPLRLTGTIMDITERSRILENLRQSDRRHKQAEALTHLGNYELNLHTNEIKMSDELYRIYSLEPSNEAQNYNIITTFRHPEDAATVISELHRAIEQKKPFDFHYRIVAKDGSIKILRARGEVLNDENNQPAKLIGTVQDITEKQKLIEKLKSSEHMYKQAEALANMGNYSMNLLTDELEWTDQLYKIYGMDPQAEKITLDRFFSFIHPDDRLHVDQCIEAFYKTGSADYTFRIITGSGEVKTLRSIAQLQVDANGKPVYVVGTEQDVTEHKKLIDSLERSQKLYKQAQSIARLGNWSFNVQTKETTWSEELFRIYELPPTEKVSFELFLSFVHPEDKEGLLAYFEKCIQEKTPYNKRHRIILRNGKIKTLQRRGELRLDAAGNVVEIFGTTQDITEQQAAENELREKQNFIQKIADATPSIIASYNINTGQYVFINEGIRKLLGYDPEEVLQKGAALFVELIHPDDLAVIMEKNQQLLVHYNQPEHQSENNIIAEFRYRIRHKNGHYRWFQTYGTIFDRNSQGLIEHLLNISLDITEQIEATQKVVEQEHFINQIADASPTILYLYNVAENRIAYINREIYYVLGYTADEIIKAGDGVTQLLYHPEDYDLLPERRESYKKFQHHNSMVQYECRMKTKSGDWCWVLVREVVFKADADGRVVEILGAALDITRRKEMEKTLLQNSFQLEQSNASLEEFAYVASHDLKEPLRKISTFGDRLINTQMDKLTDDGKIYLKKIVDASQRMQTMITDLLSISMITGDRSF